MPALPLRYARFTGRVPWRPQGGRHLGNPSLACGPLHHRSRFTVRGCCWPSGPAARLTHRPKAVRRCVPQLLVNVPPAPLHVQELHVTCSSVPVFGTAGTLARRVCHYVDYAPFGRNTRLVESQTCLASSRFHRSFSAETCFLRYVR